MAKKVKLIPYPINPNTNRVIMFKFNKPNKNKTMNDTGMVTTKRSNLTPKKISFRSSSLTIVLAT